VLWGDRVIGWGNVSVVDGELRSTFGYVEGREPRDAGFRAALEAELGGVRAFLTLGNSVPNNRAVRTLSGARPVGKAD
jgi:hypothetical protein